MPLTEFWQHYCLASPSQRRDLISRLSPTSFRGQPFKIKLAEEQKFYNSGVEVFAVMKDLPTVKGQDFLVEFIVPAKDLALLGGR